MRNIWDVLSTSQILVLKKNVIDDNQKSIPQSNGIKHGDCAHPQLIGYICDMPLSICCAMIS